MELTKRQHEIIEASCRLIADAGIQGLTTKKLAAEIGISEAAIYRHFDGKEDIIRAMLVYLKDEMAGRLGSILLTSDDALKKLDEIIMNQFGFFEKNREFAAAVLSEGMFQTTESLRDAVRDLMAVKKKLICTVVREGQESGTIRSDLSNEQITTIIMGSIRLTILRWQLDSYAYHLPAKGKSLVASLTVLLSVSGN